MDPLGWLKTNLILVLAIALGATFLFGSLGTLWYKNKAERAQLRAEVAEANLATCAAVNTSLSGSVDRQNAAVKVLETAAKRNEESAAKIAAAAAKAAKPAKDLAVAIRDFKPPENTATDPCKAERAVIDLYFKNRGAVR